MKILFHSPAKAALSEIAGLIYETKNNEWIGPRVFGIWGKPKKSKFNTKNANAEICSKCHETLENIINNL
jgi:hypothetical protein